MLEPITFQSLILQQIQPSNFNYIRIRICKVIFTDMSFSKQLCPIVSQYSYRLSSQFNQQMSDLPDVELPDPSPVPSKLANSSSLALLKLRNSFLSTPLVLDASLCSLVELAGSSIDSCKAIWCQHKPVSRQQLDDQEKGKRKKFGTCMTTPESRSCGRSTSVDGRRSIMLSSTFISLPFG